MKPSTPAAAASLQKRLDAALIDEVVVAHQQDRRVVVAGLLAEAAHHVEGAVDRHAGLERALARDLDRRSVGHRIGERHAELDQVGAGRRQALQDLVADLGIGIAGRDVDDEPGALVGLELLETLGDAAHLRPSCPMPALGDGEHVLVAAAAEIHHQQIVLGQRRRELGDMGQRMRGLERGDDALELAQELEGRRAPRCRSPTRIRRGPAPSATNARARCRDSRGRPRSNAPR